MIRCDSLKKNRIGNGFIFITVVYICTMEIMGFIRGAGIFNTEYINNYLRLIITFPFIFFFVMQIRRMRFRYIDSLIITVFIINCLLSFIINTDNIRNLFTGSYGFIIFFCIYTYYRQFYTDEPKMDKYSKALFIVLIINIIILNVLPIIGINILSVGKASLYFVVPLFFYIFRSSYIMSFISFGLMLYTQRRGALLAIFISIFCIVLFEKKVSSIKRIAFLALLIISVVSIVFVTASFDRVNMLPDSMKGIAFRIMLLNPLSDRFDFVFGSGGRVGEIISAIKPIKENPLYLFTGMGVGYSYDWVENDFVYERNHNNVHFSPVNLLTKYGLVITILLYFIIIRILTKGMISLKKGTLSINEKVMLFYTITSFINSFTAFSLFSDLFFIIFLGILEGRIGKTQSIQGPGTN